MSNIFHPHAAPVQDVDLDAPWRWLMQGWQDFRRVPVPSLVYGGIFALVGYLLTEMALDQQNFHFVMPLASGFLLMGPLFAVGLYDISRRLELGEPIHPKTCCMACRRNFSQIALMGLALVLFMLVWIRIATLIYALFFIETAPALDEFLVDTLLSPEALPFLIIGTLIGAVLAVTVFAISVVSIPMLLDRDTDALSAILTSVAAMRKNWKTLWGWACLIVLFTGAGLLFFYIGLAVTLPLVGYATWHAYRDIVGVETPPTETGA